jgi:hypothetical protein
MSKASKLDTIDSKGPKMIAGPHNNATLQQHWAQQTVTGTLQVSPAQQGLLAEPHPLVRLFGRPQLAQGKTRSVDEQGGACVGNVCS